MEFTEQTTALPTKRKTIKAGNSEVTLMMVSKQTFKQLQGSQKEKGEKLPQIVGYINTKAKTLQSAENQDCFVAKDYILPVHKQTLSNAKVSGYVYVGNEQYIQILKSNRLYLIPVAAACAVAVIVPALLFAVPKITAASGPGLAIADGQDWDGELPANGEVSQGSAATIEIPGYADLIISTDAPDVQLINPGVNDVYFVYRITDGDKLITETDAIPPGKMLSIPLGTMLGKGEFNTQFQISCYDVATQVPCNGAVQNTKVTVK